MVTPWSRRHRLRQIAAPDGQPVGTGWPYPQPPDFAPTPVDETAARARVDQAVSGLMPHAFDEATGHVPMNLINSMADQWIDQVDGEFDAYQHLVRREIALARAALAELDRMTESDVRRLAELDVARQRTFDELNAPVAEEPRTGTPQADGSEEETPGAVTQTPDGAVTMPMSVARAGVSGPADVEAPRRQSVWGEPSGAVEAAKPAKGRLLRKRQDKRPRPDAGYRAPSLVAGRPAGIFLHLLALLLAAVADLGAFAQVVQLVMANQPAVIAYLVVGGLTASVLYLAHSAGTMVRDRVAGLGSARRTWVLLAVLAWAAIGGAAFGIRVMISEQDIQAPSVSLGGDGSTTAGPDPTAMPAAILFLALFVGSGLVAAIGAYVTHNPLAGEYRVARTSYQSAAKRAGVTYGVRTAVERRPLHLRRALSTARQLRDRERRRRRHFAEELKEQARLLMAKHMQDPAFSDALFDIDRLARQKPQTEPRADRNASTGA